MLPRLRYLLSILLAVFFGYWLGGGPFAEWVTDLFNAVSLSWQYSRVSRGSGGTLWLLLAGFLFGQGLFLLGRKLIAMAGPLRAKRVEQLAAWDPAVQLGTRFGLHRYLEECTTWAADDPTARTQTLALFKIRGLGRLNEKAGTLATTQLLQRVAAELRAAALPDSVGALSRWRAHYFPRPLLRTQGGLPPPRYPARWSGATFAVAFRELDAVQAVTIARNVAEWIRQELDAFGLKEGPTLATTVAVGSAGVSARGLATTATQAASSNTESVVVALLDPADMRTALIAQMNGVEVQKASMPQCHREIPADGGQPFRRVLARWLHQWGVALGCLLSAPLLLSVVSGTRQLPPKGFVWPKDLERIQIVDPAGAREVRLIRSPLQTEKTSTWRVSDGVLVQGNPQDGFYGPFQAHVSVTNNTRHSFYVSPFDFEALDGSGRKLAIDAIRTMRITDGFEGRWLAPRESYSGWLIGNRDSTLVTGLVFEPDRSTRLEVSVPQVTQ